MKKEVIKPFSLEAYKKGAKIQTRSGAEARIICTDVKNQKFPIVALVELRDGSENAVWYTSEGRRYSNGELGPLDLVIVEEVEEPEFWTDKKYETIEGYYIYPDSTISPFCTNVNADNYGLFATKKQAKSALAMARISQIMANDIENFGGAITDEEWEDHTAKYAIFRNGNNISIIITHYEYFFLAFHTKVQRDLFLEKYYDLVKEYLMIG